MDTIRIHGLELRCIVGVRSYERRREQPLRVDLQLGLDLSAAGRSGSISDTADYSRVADEVTALLRFREYRLLEVAAEEAAALLLASHPCVERVGLRLDKPQALAGRARGASVEVERTRGAYPVVMQHETWGTRHELLAGPESTLEVLHVDPGAMLPRSPSRCLEWLTSGQLSGARPGIAARHPHDDGTHSEGYFNGGPEVAVLVRCRVNTSGCISVAAE